MNSSKHKQPKSQLASSPAGAQQSESVPAVRTADFDEQALDKQVRLGYLRHMLMDAVARKDAIKRGERTVASRKPVKFEPEPVPQPESVAEFVTESQKQARLPVPRQTLGHANNTNNAQTSRRSQRQDVAVLNSNFAEQRRYAETALEKLEMPDSPSYDLEENNLDFAPENVAVPSRVDVHEGKAANKLMNEIFSWVKSLFLAFVLAFVFVTFIAQRNIVDGSSMYPTLHNGDNLIVEKISRYFSLPSYNTIITFIKPKLQILYSEDSAGNLKREVKETPELPDTHLVKRVIGLPGDSIEIKDGHVYRNGALLQEDYLPNKVVTNAQDPVFAKVTLAENEIYVLGDNREHSSDSRYFGPVKVKAIVGRSLVRFYPFSRVGVPR